MSVQLIMPQHSPSTDATLSVLKTGEHFQAVDGLGSLSLIMDANPVPCFVIDASHHVVHWNKGCEHILGLPASRMIGTHDQWTAFYEKPRATLADLIVDQQVLENDLYKNKKLRHSRIVPNAFEAEDFFPLLGDGGRWLFFTAAPVIDCNGEIIGAVETLQDITTQRKAEIALQESNNQLENRIAARTLELAQKFHR